MHIHIVGDSLVSGEAQYQEGGAPDPWVSWCWNSAELRATTDPLGFRPLFYYASADRVIVGTTLTEIVQKSGSTTLDYEMLAVFLRLGYPIGDRTPFVEIKVLPPDGTLVWKPGTWEIDGAAKIDVARTTGSRTQLIDEYGHRFAHAIRARPPVGRVMLPLSGGRDSRHILAELLVQNIDVDRVVTVVREDVAGFRDAVTASAIVKEYGLTQQTCPVPQRSLELETRKNLLTHLNADEHYWLMSLAEELSSGRGTLYDGIGGDVLSSGVFMTKERLRMLDQGNIRSFVRDIQPYGDASSSINQAFSRDFAERVSDDVAYEVIEKEVEKHLGAPNPISSFFFWNRTRREIAMVPFAMFRSPSLTVRTPYLDIDLVRFLQSIPAEMLLDKKFHTETISHVHAELGCMPYGDLRPSDLPGRLYWLTTARLPGFNLARQVKAAGLVTHWLPNSPYSLAFRPSMSLAWYAGIPAYMHSLAEICAMAEPKCLN